jgi:two-component system response regulator YesN
MAEEVKCYIEQNYMYDIGINEIAEKLNVTPNYLSTYFHKKTGITFIRYLTEVRMLRAKKMLENPNITVQDVAGQVGYYSTSHFIKLFKEYFGVYPSKCQALF